MERVLIEMGPDPQLSLCGLLLCQHISLAAVYHVTVMSLK